jgi:hypothetical protein
MTTVWEEEVTAAVAEQVEAVVQAASEALALDRPVPRWVTVIYREEMKG